MRVIAIGVSATRRIAVKSQYHRDFTTITVQLLRLVSQRVLVFSIVHGG